MQYAVISTMAQTASREAIMDNYVLEELIENIKRGLVWFIVTVIFTSSELKEEVFRHVYSGVIRIPGVCYGANIIRGYRVIGNLFPRRCHIVRLDFIMGYVKILLIAACVFGLLILLANALA